MNFADLFFYKQVLSGNVSVTLKAARANARENNISPLPISMSKHILALHLELVTIPLGLYTMWELWEALPTLGQCKRN